MTFAPLPVLVPDAAGAADDLLAALRSRGLPTDHSPFVELRAQRDGDLRAALAALAAGEVDRLVVTSPRAAEVLAEGGDLLVPAGTAVAVTDAATAAVLAAAGVPDARVLEREETDPGFAAALSPDAGERLLLVGSTATPPALRPALEAAGARVTLVLAVRVRTVGLDPQLVRDLRRPAYGALVLRSTLLADLAGHLGIHRDIRVVAADDAVAATAEARGLVVHAAAGSTGAEELATAVLSALGTQIVHD